LRLLAARLSFGNPWVAAVDAAPRRPPALLVLALALLVGAGAVAGGRAAAGPLASALRLQASPLGREAAADLCIFLPLWALAALGGAWEGRATWRRGGGGADAGLGLGLGLILYGGAVLLAAGVGVVAGGREGGGAGALGGVLAGLLLTAFQAGAEEAVFRGWLQPLLCARWGVWVGLLAASAAFAALHLVAGERSPMALLNLLLGGIVFGLLALRSGGLWAPFAAHLGWNWLEASVLGLEPNPGVGATGSLLDLDLVGSGLWSGGADAMNGSLAMTLVLAAAASGLTVMGRFRRD
jgi:uncharacterized protein